MYVRKNNCNVVTEISEKMDKELIKQNGFKNKNLGESILNYKIRSSRNNG